MPLHVLVIGGGLGGLCLAQGLNKSGISVAVYERDRSAQFRSQGYRISLKEDGSHALRDCLPQNLFNLCVATAIKSATRMVFLDHHLNQKFMKPIPPLPPDSFFGVNRFTLREILLAGLEGIVHFDKTFERLEQLDNGRVRAHFADGTSATGDLLVGADGTSSAVRPIVAPDAVLDDLDYAIYGKTLITPEIMEWFPEVLFDSFNRITAPDGTGMAVATCRKREAFSNATARLAPHVHLTDIKDYFSWTLSRRSQEFHNIDPLTLHEMARAMLKDWPHPVRRIIDEADVPATFLVTIRSARPVKQWQTPNVTLLGDAIHTMSPGRGEGANTALRDARLFRQALMDVVTKGIPLAQAKAQYETEMLRYGFEMVADSLNTPFAPSTNRGKSNSS